MYVNKKENKMPNDNITMDEIIEEIRKRDAEDIPTTTSDRLTKIPCGMGDTVLVSDIVKRINTVVDLIDPIDGGHY